MKKGVEEDQIRWRRNKLAELEALRRDGSTRLLFGQEFPEDDVKCFLASGDMVYNRTILDTLEAACFPAPAQIEGADVWEPPREFHKYLVAIDPGQGKHTRSGITIWRFETIVGDLSSGTRMIHVATSASYDDPEQTASRAAKLGLQYNGAIIAVEANAHGLAVITELKNTQAYLNLYLRKDFVTGLVGKEIGWLTTGRTKPFMITQLSKALGNMECYDLNIISELRSIRKIKNEVVALGLDDLHMSSAIAACCWEGNNDVGFVGQGGWSQTWGSSLQGDKSWNRVS